MNTLKNKFELWCKNEKDTLEAIARAIRVDGATLNRYINKQRRPKKEIVEAIWLYTEGYIQPADFYDLEKIKNKTSKSKKR
jgi:hypothetical protein